MLEIDFKYSNEDRESGLAKITSCALKVCTAVYVLEIGIYSLLMDALCSGGIWNSMQ